MNLHKTLIQFGLSTEETAILTTLFAHYLPQGKVLIYGSRVKGNFTERSDIDLAIADTSTTDRHLLAELKDQIDESDFPYLCDLQYLEEIKNPHLLEHIKRVGKVFYQRK